MLRIPAIQFRVTMIKKILFISAIFFLFAAANSQTKDFGIWYGISLNHELSKKIDVSVAASLRTYDNASLVDLFYLEPGTSYKFNKYFSVGAAYRLIYKREAGAGFFDRHRWLADAKFSYPVKKFKFSARFRLQEQYKTYADNKPEVLNEYYGRIKAQVYYNWPSFPVNPYVSMEYFYPLNTGTVKFADKKRLVFGAKYSISKKQTLEAEYMYQRDYLPRLADFYAISLNYQIEI